RPSKVFYHRIGNAQTEDRLIFEEKDPGFFVNVSGSTLNDYIFIDIHDHQTSECWLLPADNPSAEPRLVKKRQAGIEYDLEPGGDRFYTLNNADGAKDFKIMSTPVASSEPENWREVVAEVAGRLRLSHAGHNAHLLRLARDGRLPRNV